MRTGERQYRWADQSGAAVVEFVVLAVLVMVPVAYAVLVIGSVHAASFGTVTAAREAGRAYTTADAVVHGAARAQLAARTALRDQGIESEPQLRISCLQGSCLQPGSAVRVEVTTFVPLPLLPGDGGPANIPVTAVHVAPVDTFRESP